MVLLARPFFVAKVNRVVVFLLSSSEFSTLFYLCIENVTCSGKYVDAL